MSFLALLTSVPQKSTYETHATNTHRHKPENQKKGLASTKKKKGKKKNKKKDSHKYEIGNPKCKLVQMGNFWPSASSTEKKNKTRHNEILHLLLKQTQTRRDKLIENNHE